MLKIEAVATTWYTYELTDEEEKKVRDIIKENEHEWRFKSAEEQILEAFEQMYNDCETELYNDKRTVESDFNTDEFNYSEFNECNAEKWLDEFE